MYIGLDAGTSSIKAVLVNDNGDILSEFQKEINILRFDNGKVEQNPDEWISALLFVLTKTGNYAASIDTERIEGIGISGQMHGLVMLDKAGIPIGNAIIWLDKRSNNEIHLIEKMLGKDTIRTKIKNPLFPGFMFPSLLWVKNNCSAIYQQIANVLFPKDYLRYVLTGEIGTEFSDASASLIYDFDFQSWSKEILERFQISSSLFPEISNSYSICGYLKKEIAEKTGLQSGIPVVFGGADQACQALGCGVMQEGSVTCTIGTGGQIFTPVKGSQVDTDLKYHFFQHVVPDTFYRMGATLSAGLSIRWLRDQIQFADDYEDLTNMAMQSPPGANEVIFLPYLEGERTPYMSSSLSGIFWGLRSVVSKSDMIRSVYEGVVFSIFRGVKIINNMDLSKVTDIVLSGGALNHEFWSQLVADIFGFPISRPEYTQTAAVGAAILSAYGIGRFDTLVEAVDAISRISPNSTLSVQENHEKYQRTFRKFEYLSELINENIGVRNEYF